MISLFIIYYIQHYLECKIMECKITEFAGNYHIFSPIFLDVLKNICNFGLE